MATQYLYFLLVPVLLCKKHPPMLLHCILPFLMLLLLIKTSLLSSGKTMGSTSTYSAAKWQLLTYNSWIWFFWENILPCAAALLDISPITDVTEIHGPIYADNALSTVHYTGTNPCMLTIRSTSFRLGPMPTGSNSDAASLEKFDLSSLDEDDAIGKSEYINLSSQESERPDLGNALVMVTGGRALKVLRISR